MKANILNAMDEYLLRGENEFKMIIFTQMGTVGLLVHLLTLVVFAAVTVKTFNQNNVFSPKFACL